MRALIIVALMIATFAPAKAQSVAISMPLGAHPHLRCDAYLPPTVNHGMFAAALFCRRRPTKLL